MKQRETKARKCRECYKPLLPASSYRSHQSVCWPCYNGTTPDESKELIENGSVYIAEYYNMFSGETTDGLYKVGMTSRTNVQTRMGEIGDTTGVMKVRLVRSWLCEDPYGMEHKIHELLKDNRIEGEWFAIDKIKLISILNEN